MPHLSASENEVLVRRVRTAQGFSLGDVVRLTTHSIECHNGLSKILEVMKGIKEPRYTDKKETIIALALFKPKERHAGDSGFYYCAKVQSGRRYCLADLEHITDA